MFGEREWKEKDFDKKKKRFMPKDLERTILERLGHAPLPEKENELLNKNFELKDDLENAATKEDYDNLFNNISNRVNILKKLVKTVADNVEKKRVHNVISTAQKMKFFIKDFFSKCEQIRRKLQIWSHLLRKSLMENFVFWAVKDC